MKQYPYKGIDTSHYKFIPWGYKTLSDSVNHLMSGSLVVVTGRPSEGKSTFVHSVILNAIDKKKKVLLVDGEHHQNILLSNLCRKAIGNDSSLYNRKPFGTATVYDPKPHVLKLINEWMQDLHICSKYKNDLSDFDNIFELFQEYVKKEKIDLIVLDNLMSLVDSTQSEMNAKQSKFMKKCSSLAKAANIPIILIAHPNATANKGKKMDYYQISGTGDIPNLADVIIQIIKDPTNNLDEKIADGMIGILKNRYGEKYDDILLAFDTDTYSLCEIIDGTYGTIMYNWRNEGKQTGFRTGSFVTDNGDAPF